MSTEPIGLARDLAPKGVMRAQIGHTDIAIWRSTNGVVSAWENRCPHRGMRLSHGFVRGESLACAYHGWHYDCSGKCHYIPAHPELEPPSTIRPSIYSVVEQAGILWVNTIADADPVTLPKDLLSIRSITLACDLPTAIDSFSSAAQTEVSLFNGSVSVFSQQPSILSLSSPDGADGIFILFQQPYPHRVVAHVLANNLYQANDLIALSRWCESVRRAAEQNTQSSNAPASSL
ncbi:MAG: Rieske (2Fe-2S) protein [Granulosicoccaceae bacterium]